VRIIRAIRFSAKLAALGFSMEPKTLAPLVDCSKLLADVPQSRLFDEMLKLLQTGHAVATVAQLRKLGLATGIYPLLDVIVERADQPFVKAALQDTDRRVGEGKPVAPSFLLACVLWADVRDGWAQRSEGRHGQRPQASFPALQDAIDDVFNARIGDVSGRGKLAADMREIWMMQPRFDKRTGSTPYSLVEQARFRAAFDFMRLRADVGEVSEAIAEWWQEFSSTSDEVRRQDLLDQVRDEQHKRTRQRAPARTVAPAAAPAGDGADQALPPDGEFAAAAPRKRRRRRKPRTGGEAGSSVAAE
jgi:poly(A) polymerase